MARKSLEEIFGSTQRKSLDEIFGNGTQQVPNLTPLTEEQKKQPTSRIDGVGMAGLKGLIQGLGLGAEKVASGATLGGYDWANRKLGGDFAERDAENQALAEAMGAGTLNNIAKFGAELGGNVSGAGGTLSKVLGTSARGLIGAGAIEGATYGATGSDTLEEALANVPVGAIVGGAGGAVGAGIGRAIKSLSPVVQTMGKKAGLSNILKDNDSIKLLKRSIKADENIANQVSAESTSLADNINQNSADALNKALGRQINLEQASTNAKARYGDYINQHAADEVLDFSPRRQLQAISAESSYNPNMNYSIDKARNVLSDRADRASLDIFGDIDHFTGAGRRKYLRTLNNTLDKPDFQYTQKSDKGEIRDYLVKKYQDNLKNEPFYDLVFKQNGELFDKFNTKENYMLNQFKKPTENLSFSRRATNVSEPTSGDIRAYDSILPQNGAVVNPNLANYETLLDGLNPYQKNAMRTAIKNGLEKTNQKAGSLESINRIKQELGDMVESSKVAGDNGKMNATSNTVQLSELKQKIDDILHESSDIKKLDTQYKRVKEAESSYYQGKNYQKGDNVDFTSNINKKSFAQGLRDKILSDVTPEKNTSTEVKKYQNVLKKVISENKYNELMRNVQQNETQFKRLQDITRKADNKLVTPEPIDRPWSERIESIGSALGAAGDKVLGGLYNRANRETARRLLNGFDANERNIYYDILMNYSPAVSGIYGGKVGSGKI